MTRLWSDTLSSLMALLVAMAAGSVLIIIYGASPAHIYDILLSGTLGNAYGLGQVIYKATPLIFTGLSVSLAFRAGLFNIGAEGQLLVGAFLCALVGTWLGGLPSIIAIPLCVLAALLGGAAVGFIPGWLRARFGAHEVINTIMLNFIASAGVLWAGGAVFVKESLHTAPVAEAARIPRLSGLFPSLHGTAANWSILLALLAALGVWALLWRTRTGFALRALGHSPDAAACGGVPVGRTMILAMTLSGALAGLVGANFVLGYKGYFEEGFSGGVGFMGIAVALLGRNHPVGVILAALLFGMLSQGGLAINALVPKEIVDVLQAVIILAVAATSQEVRRVVRGGE